MLSIFWVVLTLALIMFLAFKRLNIAFISILAVIILAILDGMPVISTLTDVMMPGMAAYVQSYFLLFTISACFGKAMEMSGSAASIAKGLIKIFGNRFAIIGIMVAGSLLVWGGISSLVIAFTVYPIALAVFEKADLPRYLIPGVIAGSCFTFAASAFPGTPQAMNVIPQAYLGTDVMAASALGVITGVIGFVLAYGYMFLEGEKARKKGQHFEANEDVQKLLDDAAKVGENVNPVIAIVPIALVIVMLVGFKANVLLSVAAGTVLCIILQWKNLRFESLKPIIETGISNGANAVITTGAIVGYGSVVKASSGFSVLSEKLTKMKASPLITFALTTTIIAGVAGSGFGGLVIALQAFAKEYLALGIPAEVLHRVGALAAIGLDSLPHNGAVVVLLGLCGMTHKDSYKQIFVTTVVITVLVAIISVPLAQIMYM